MSYKYFPEESELVFPVSTLSYTSLCASDDICLKTIRTLTDLLVFDFDVISLGTYSKVVPLINIMYTN